MVMQPPTPSFLVLYCFEVEFAAIGVLLSAVLDD